MRRLVLLTLAAAPGWMAGEAHGQPYRWVDAGGNVHYSDRRPQQPPGPVEDLDPRIQPPRDDRASAPTSAPAPRPAPVPDTRAAPTSTSAPPPTATRPARPAETTPTAEAASRRALEVTRALELIDLTGIDQWLDYFARSVRWELDRLVARRNLPDGLRAPIARAFHRDALAGTVARAFERDDEAPRMDAVLAWYRSSLGRRLAEQRREPAPAVVADYRAFVKNLPAMPPSWARVALVHRMDRAWRSSEFEPDIRRAVRAALERLVASRLPRAEPEEEEIDESLLSADESRRFSVVTWTLHRYQAFSDVELRRYVEFLESAAGAWLTHTSRQSVLDSLKAAEDRAAAALPRPR